ncbi:MAG: hypothetical protein IK054_04840, partial [Lachnospiraceae bacterium]|nr:hypothetical protein [Lachnospiraceae bacterium]
SDEALQRKLEERTDAYEGDPADERAVFEAIILPLAKEAGFELSYEDMTSLADNKKGKRGKMLTDDELMMVAGGVSNETDVMAKKGLGESLSSEDMQAFDFKNVIKNKEFCIGVGIGIHDENHWNGGDHCLGKVVMTVDKDGLTFGPHYD